MEWGGRGGGDVDGESWGQWRMHCTRMGEEEKEEHLSSMRRRIDEGT